MGTFVLCLAPYALNRAYGLVARHHIFTLLEITEGLVGKWYTGTFALYSPEFDSRRVHKLISNGAGCGDGSSPDFVSISD